MNGLKGQEVAQTITHVHVKSNLLYFFLTYELVGLFQNVGENRSAWPCSTGLRESSGDEIRSIARIGPTARAPTRGMLCVMRIRRLEVCCRRRYCRHCWYCYYISISLTVCKLLSPPPSSSRRPRLLCSTPSHCDVVNASLISTYRRPRPLRNSLSVTGT